MSARFVHLNVHTEYAIIDGIIRPSELIARTKAAQLPAVAITDHINLFGSIKFYREALAAGIKPLIGCEINVVNDLDSPHLSRIILLCLNSTGYLNLKKLVSECYLHGQHNHAAAATQAQVFAHQEGLIAIHLCQHGPASSLLQQNQLEEAKQVLSPWQETFSSRFYLDIELIQANNEIQLVQNTLALAEQMQCPVVATNSVCFLNQDDYHAHEARLCIQHGYVLDDPKRPRTHTTEQYYKSAEQMEALFKTVPQALANTIEIAKRCNLTIPLGTPCLPQFQAPDNQDVESYFQMLSTQGLERRINQTKVASELIPSYQERLEFEINIINKMGFPSYFLIVADFIKWAKSNHIPVGPGRGSGAGSLIAYSLGITDLDPLQHELLFERFLNPERVSMPDFDIDFCMDRRDDVIHYVMEKYGRDSVCQIITFGRMAAKAVVRDIGRVMGYPYGFVDKIAKLIPFEIGMTLEKALLLEPQLDARYQEEEEVRDLIDLAKKLEGVTRNAGKHAGGVVISPSKLTDFTALYCEPDGSNLVSQLDKDDVEAAGLVKFDFLGLRTLTIIQWTINSINQTQDGTAEPIMIEHIPLDDKATYDLMKRCSTTAVFQLESRGMKELIGRLQPDTFEEITALVALFRPGPLQSGMVDDFIDRKHGRAQSTYPHPLLEPILKPTYGVILYQEQVMQIAQKLSGYSLGGADLLRRAMGKKKPEEMAKQRDTFVSGAEKNNIDAKLAGDIFDLIEKFAGYGFNKSHSAAYALIAYQTAWLKAHYTDHFMAAVLSSDMDNTDKVVIFLNECQQLGIKVTPPSIHESLKHFHVSSHHTIVFGLGAIKGVGESAIDELLAARKEHQSFKSLFDLCQKVDCRKVNRKVLEALIKSGALDCFDTCRAKLFASIDTALQTADQLSKNKAQGQSDLFGSMMALENTTSEFGPEPINATPWSRLERLQNEKQVLGFYQSGHPVDQHLDDLKHLTTTTLSDLNHTKKDKATVAGMMQQCRTRINKKGKKMAFLTLEDHTGSIDVAIYSDVYEQVADLLENDNILVIQGEVSLDHYSGKMSIQAKDITTLEQARSRSARGLVLHLDLSQPKFDLMALVDLLSPYKNGKCPAIIKVSTPEAQGTIQLGPAWQLTLNEKLLKSLKQCQLLRKIETLYT